MRLRVCIILAAVAGAAGSMVLAVDMYRRLAAAERSAMESASATHAAGLVFGAAHVLGTAGMGVLFFAIGLLLFAEKKRSAAAMSVASSNASTGQAAEVAASVVVPLGEYAQASELPASDDSETHSAELFALTRRPSTHIFPSSPPDPVAPLRTSNDIDVVHVSPAPEHNPMADSGVEEIGTPIPVSDTEFRRAVLYEKVLQEQGEVPEGILIESESKTIDAVLGNGGDEPAPTPQSSPLKN